MHCHQRASDHHVRLAKVHLRFVAGLVLLLDVHVAIRQPQLTSPSADVPPYGRLRSCASTLAYQSLPDSARRMALLRSPHLIVS